jgi:hypothetical protein
LLSSQASSFCFSGGVGWFTGEGRASGFGSLPARRYDGNLGKALSAQRIECAVKQQKWHPATTIPPRQFIGHVGEHSPLSLAEFVMCAHVGTTPHIATTIATNMIPHMEPDAMSRITTKILPAHP